MEIWTDWWVVMCLWLIACNLMPEPESRGEAWLQVLIGLVWVGVGLLSLIPSLNNIQ